MKKENEKANPDLLPDGDPNLPDAERTRRDYQNMLLREAAQNETEQNQGPASELAKIGILAAIIKDEAEHHPESLTLPLEQKKLAGVAETLRRKVIAIKQGKAPATTAMPTIKDAISLVRRRPRKGEPDNKRKAPKVNTAIVLPLPKPNAGSRKKSRNRLKGIIVATLKLNPNSPNTDPGFTSFEVGD